MSAVAPLQLLDQRFVCPKASQVFDFLSWFFSADMNSIFSDI
jgi:hypothetical protein